MRDFLDVGCFMAVAVTLVVIPVLLIMAVVSSVIGPINCEGRWPEYETRWEFWGGCLVQTEDGWMNEDVLISVLGR